MPIRERGPKSSDTAETVALQALGFLAADDDILARFMALALYPEVMERLFELEAVRAHRRWLEEQAAGLGTSEADVLAELQARDARDAARAAAPMRAADDALQLDTSRMSIEEAVAAAVAAISDRMDRG